MKVLLASVALASTLALAAPAGAQSWQSVNARQAQLDQRIDAGVRNGSLTRSEAARLRADFRDIAILEQRYRATGGLSLGERADLDQRFDALSARIRYERHDWQDRRGNWWAINARQRELDRRIDAGVRQGELTRPEAARLRAQFNGIARLERQYRASGGGLTLAERRDLDRRFAILAQRIRWERNDWQDRG